MRPLQLVLQAFGPYAGVEEIDFTKLGNRNMFVISGKTGAGKTTIFDGISFAIYGKASGEERNGPDLRSHFADPDLQTEVSLTFQLRDKTYSIWRSPMQERKKKSGEGTVKVNAKAELYEYNADGKEIIAANVREVDEKIKDIIGLDATQFKQILMIPQGDFKKLLVSESVDKEVILQKLFHTQVYKKIEEKLKEEASFIKKDAEYLQLEINSLISSIIWNKNVEWENESPKQIAELLHETLNESKEEADQLQNDYKHKEAWEKVLQKEIFQAKELIVKFEEKQKYVQEKAELDANKDQMNAQKVELLAAQKAGHLEKQEHAYLRIGKRVQETKQAVSNLEQQVALLQKKKGQAEERYQNEVNKNDLREEAAKKVMGLQELQQDIVTLAELQKEVAHSEKLWKQECEQINHLEKKQALLEQQLLEIEASLTESQKASLRYSEKQHEKDKYQEALELVQEYKAASEQQQQVKQFIEKQQEAIKNVEVELQKEQQLFIKMEQNIRQSQAFILATRLQEGQPCAVCGSTEHPSPATSQSHEDAYSDEQYEMQKEVVLKLEKQQQNLQQELYRLQVQCDHLQGNETKQEQVLQAKLSFFDKHDLQAVLEQVQTVIHDAQQQLNMLQKQKDDLPRLEKHMKILKEQGASLQEQMKASKVNEEEHKAKYIQSETKWESSKARVPESLRSEAAYQKAISEAIQMRNELQGQLEEAQLALQRIAQEETKLMTTIETNEQSLQSLQKELEEEREIFKQEMNKQGFETYQAYKEAQRTEADMEAISHRMDQYEQDYQRVESLLTHLEYTLKGIEVPNVALLEQQAEHLGEEMKKVHAALSEIQLTIKQNEKLLDQLYDRMEKQENIQQKYETMGHLADIAKGQNPFRITFERYVLAAFLDDILHEANERLTKMTGGRYQLWRKVDPIRKNVQSGLELTVFDQYTGMERHVKTLSGGESFKASLSLALGLAAVVQQNAGGISLETMFIDEGFGTLDPESLDQAIEALLDIQSTGRLVGIISHVPELKERIDARLEVAASQSGSKTSFVLS